MLPRARRRRVGGADRARDISGRCDRRASCSPGSALSSSRTRGKTSRPSSSIDFRRCSAGTGRARSGGRAGRHRALASWTRVGCATVSGEPTNSAPWSTSASNCARVGGRQPRSREARSNVSSQYGHWVSIASSSVGGDVAERVQPDRKAGRVPVLGQRAAVKVDERAEPLRPATDHREHQRQPVACGADHRVGAAAGADPGREVAGRERRGQNHVVRAAAGTCPDQVTGPPRSSSTNSPSFSSKISS